MSYPTQDGWLTGRRLCSENIEGIFNPIVNRIIALVDQQVKAVEATKQKVAVRSLTRPPLALL